MMHTVFVYGTLKQGGQLHGLLKDSTFVREATTRGNLYLRPGYWFPQAKPGPGVLHGELYSGLTPAMLERLDRAEGHPSLYKRTKVDIDGGGRAWVYWYMPVVEEECLVPEGRFDARSHH